MLLLDIHLIEVMPESVTPPGIITYKLLKKRIANEICVQGSID
jgi:hypothetical protein